MEPDSFLDLLSPDFNDLDAIWASNPANTDPFTVSVAAFSWLTDEFINTEGIEKYEEEDEEEEEEEIVGHDKHMSISSKSLSSTPASALGSTILSNASEYSSVLKLSDIASALHNFSKAAGITGPHYRRNTPLRKPSPALSGSSVPPLSPFPSISSSFVRHSSLPSVCAFSKFTSNSLAGKALSVEVSPMKCVADASVNHTGVVDTAPLGCTDVAIVKESCRKQISGDSGATNEKESSSKLTGNGGNSGWDVSKDEDNEAEDDSAYSEDVQPCVSHVRIVRRPNSNCGQASSPSPKRAKLADVKMEVTSSCEMLSLQDDKDGGSSLNQMRKEGMSQREVHILSERQRRKGMRESFSILQSMVPKLKLKQADRITVLTEVITYIQSLHGTLEELGSKKADMMELLGLTPKAKSRGCNAAAMQGTITYVNPDNDGSSDEKAGDDGYKSGSLQNGERVMMVEVTVRMCGSYVFITLSTPRHRGMWSGVLRLLQKFRIEVSNATMTTCGDSSFHCIHAKATNLPCVEGVDLQEKLEDVIVKELRRPSRERLL